MIREVNADLAQEKELKVTTGVLIDSLTESSAAREAGIKKNDVILSVDGVEVNSVPKLQELIARKRPGDKVDIQVNRFGKVMNFNVVLYNQEGNEDIVEARSVSSIEEYLGAELEDIDEETARKMNISGGVRIARLNNGKIKETTNVKPGFIITKVDNRAIRNKEQLLNYLKSKKGGVLIEGRYEDYPGEYYFGLGME
jgi:S1-C subfamily serine protease